MAPALNTRSAARKNGVTLRSLDAGVHKHFQCIICDTKHGSRAALSRHFKSHTTRPEELSPFTHPSCWDEDSATYPPSKKHIYDMIVDDEIFDALPSRKQRAINANIEYALAGVRNKKQLQQKQDQQRLRLLHWWFRVNEDSLRARMEFGPKGLFPRQGNLITLERKGLAANLMAWLRRTQARRSGPGILRRGNHSGRRQPARARRRTSDLTTRAAFRGESPNNRSRPAGPKPRPSRSLSLCPIWVFRPRLRPLAQGISHCRLRASIDSRTHKLAATVVHEQHLHPFRQGPRRRYNLRYSPQTGRGGILQRHRSFSRCHEQAELAFRLKNHEQVRQV